MGRGRSSLAVRIAALSVGVAVITALIGGLIAVRLVKDATESGARQTLSNLADDLQADASTAPIRTLIRLKGLKIDSGAIGPRGRIEATSPVASEALTQQQIRDVLAGQSVSTVSEVGGQSYLVEARPVRGGGIVVVQPEAQADAPGQGVVRKLVLALVIAGAIAVAVGLLVSFRLSRPLKRTAAAARALARGSRDVVVEPEGPIEVADVADALNTLGSSLARSEARQRDFLLSVSHDLRTPLTAISGHAESLVDGLVDPAQVGRVGGVVLGEARRMERLVTDLLDLARLDAQALRIDLTHVDLTGLVDGAAAAWEPRCRSEGILLSVERPSEPAEPLWVDTDPTRLRQVLDGLIENALRVVPAGQPIVLATRRETGPDGRRVAAVEVRDGGPGLSDDDLAVAFDRAALYDRYRSIRKVGTGLGLAIVHQLTSRLGGTVEAGHSDEGGARFTVRLPIH